MRFLTFIKLVKYNLNLAGACWMLFITDLSYALASDFPNCKHAPELIITHLPKLFSTFYIPFLLAMTLINYLFERFIEKKKAPKEYLFLLVIQSFVLLLIACLVSYLYYRENCQR